MAWCRVSVSRGLPMRSQKLTTTGGTITASSSRAGMVHQAFVATRT